MCVWQLFLSRMGTLSKQGNSPVSYIFIRFDQAQPSPMRMMDLRSPLWSLCTVQFCVGLSIRNSPKLETIYHVSWLMVTLSANWVITKGRLVLLALKTCGFLSLMTRMWSCLWYWCMYVYLSSQSDSREVRRASSWFMCLICYLTGISDVAWFNFWNSILSVYNPRSGQLRRQPGPGIGRASPTNVTKHSWQKNRAFSQTEV